MTKQDVLDLARIDLKDDLKERYTDAALAMRFDDLYAEARRQRPDMFIGHLVKEPPPLALPDAVVLPRWAIARIAKAIAGMALLRDDEIDGKSGASAFLQLGMMP